MYFCGVYKDINAEAETHTTGVIATVVKVVFTRSVNTAEIEIRRRVFQKQEYITTQ